MLIHGGNIKNISVNNKKLRFKLWEFSSFLAAFSPLYFKFIFGKTYFSGFIVGGLCSWGFNNIYNKIPLEEEKQTYFYKAKKRKQIRKLITALKAIEMKKRMSDLNNKADC